MVRARAPSFPRIPVALSCCQTPIVAPALASRNELESEATLASTRACCIGMEMVPRPVNGWPKAKTSPVASSTWVTVPLAISTMSPPMSVAPTGLPGPNCGTAVCCEAPARAVPVSPPGASSIPSCRNSGARTRWAAGLRPLAVTGARMGSSCLPSFSMPTSGTGIGSKDGSPADEKRSVGAGATPGEAPAPRGISVKRTISSKGVIPQMGSFAKGKAYATAPSSRPST